MPAHDDAVPRRDRRTNWTGSIRARASTSSWWWIGSNRWARRVVKTGDGEIAAPKEKLRPGDAVADFELRDQHGQTVRLSDFRGKVVAIDFIYTRCPLPDVCPRLSASFATLQRRFHDRLGDLVLLSITVDPEYDTPRGPRGVRQTVGRGQPRLALS